MGLLTATDEEVVRLDIAVDEVLRVEVFDPVQHLIRQHEQRLERKPKSNVNILNGFRGLRRQMLNKSSREGPSKSITMMLKSPRST